MTRNPRVSVVIGVYNCGPFLDQTIASVARQEFEDWELILVDDGSTDATPHIIERWVASDPRVRSIRQPNSGRPAPARNRGIREARGDIIAFLDGDDLFHPGKLACQVSVFDRYPDVGAVFHDYYCFPDGGEPADGLLYLVKDRYFERAGPVLAPVAHDGGRVYLGTPDLIKFMSSESVGIHTSTIAVRREVLRSLDQPPFNEDLPHGEDIHLWLRLARQTRIAILPQPLSYYRLRQSDSWMTGNKRRTLARGAYLVKSEMLSRLENMLTPEERPAYLQRLSRGWNGLGYNCLVAGLNQETRHCYREALRLAPTTGHKLRALKGLLVSVLPRPLVRGYWRLRRSGEFEVRPLLSA